MSEMKIRKELIYNKVIHKLAYPVTRIRVHIVVFLVLLAEYSLNHHLKYSTS